MGKTELLGVPEIREYIVDYWFDLLLLDTHKDAEVMPQHKDPIGSLSIDIPKEGSRWASTREDRSSAWATIGNGKPLPEFPLVPHIRPQPSNQIKFQFGKIENPPETGDLWGRGGTTATKYSATSSWSRAQNSKLRKFRSATA